MYICTLYTLRLGSQYVALPRRTLLLCRVVRIESISAQRDAARHSLAGQCEPSLTMELCCMPTAYCALCDCRFQLACVARHSVGSVPRIILSLSLPPDFLRQTKRVGRHCAAEKSVVSLQHFHTLTLFSLSLEECLTLLGLSVELHPMFRDVSFCVPFHTHAVTPTKAAHPLSLSLVLPTLYN